MALSCGFLQDSRAPWYQRPTVRTPTAMHRSAFLALCVVFLAAFPAAANYCAGRGNRHLPYDGCSKGYWQASALLLVLSICHAAGSLGRSLPGVCDRTDLSDLVAAAPSADAPPPPSAAVAAVKFFWPDVVLHI